MQYAACSQKRQEQFHGLGVPRTTTPPPEVCCCNLICLDQPKSLEKDKERKSFNAAGRDSATVSVTIYFTSEPRLVLLTSTQNKLQVHKLGWTKKRQKWSGLWVATPVQTPSSQMKGCLAPVALCWQHRQQAINISFNGATAEPVWFLCPQM